MIQPGQMKFKACSRCKGDVVLGSDRYGFYLQCCQCGHLWDLPQVRVNRVGKQAA